MDSHGHPWNTMEVNRFPRKSIHINLVHCISVDLKHKTPLIPVDVHGYQWIPTFFPWIFMENNLANRSGLPSRAAQSIGAMRHGSMNLGEHGHKPKLSHRIAHCLFHVVEIFIMWSQTSPRWTHEANGPHGAICPWAHGRIGRLWAHTRGPTLSILGLKCLEVRVAPGHLGTMDRDLPTNPTSHNNGTILLLAYDVTDESNLFFISL